MWWRVKGKQIRGKSSERKKERQRAREGGQERGGGKRGRGGRSLRNPLGHWNDFSGGDSTLVCAYGWIFNYTQPLWYSIRLHFSTQRFQIVPPPQFNTIMSTPSNLIFISPQ